MKRIFIKSFLFIAAGLLLNSCINDNEQEFNVFADAYVIKKLDNSEHVFANAYYVYGNEGIKSATVTTPGGSSIELGVLEFALYTFMKEPAGNDFSEEVPIPGSYLFQVTSENGVEISANDMLEYTGIPVPGITKSEYKSSDQALQIEWNPVAGCNGLVVKLYNLAGKLVYLGYQLDWDATDYQIIRNFGDWQEEPKIGQTYSLQVHAFAYESDLSDQEMEIYNLQEISIGEKIIIWGQ